MLEMNLKLKKLSRSPEKGTERGKTGEQKLGKIILDHSTLTGTIPGR